jgi:RimJ/RimL family protein N-acetyltransferase
MRKIVVPGERVALAEWVDGDKEWLEARNDGAYDVERDDRPMPYKLPMDRLAVTSPDGGDLLGDVSWHPVMYGPSRGCMAWNVGIVLLPSNRGKGRGTEVLRLLALHLFDTTDIDRVEASTDADNIPTQRALVKAGFTREGVLRGAQLRGGERRDMIAYSILRSDVTDGKLTAGQNESAELASGDGRL